MFRRLTHKFSRWLLLPVLLQAFLVTGALSSVDVGLKGGAQTTQVCSMSGMKWIHAKGSLDSTGTTHGSTHEHCSLCACASALSSPQFSLLVGEVPPQFVGRIDAIDVDVSPPIYDHPPAQAPPRSL